MPKKLADRIVANRQDILAIDRQMAEAVRDIKEMDKQLKTDEKAREALEQEQSDLQARQKVKEKSLKNVQDVYDQITEKKADLKSTKDKTEKAELEAEIKKLEAKARKLGDVPDKLEAEIKEIEKALKKNQADWKKSVEFSSALQKKKQATEKSLDSLKEEEKAADVEAKALAVKERAAAEVDKLTLNQVLADSNLRAKFGKWTYNEEAVEFLDVMQKKGNRGDLAVYNKYVRNDDINLDGDKGLRKRFDALEAQGASADWDGAEAREVWAKAATYVERMLHSDSRQLDQFQTKLKEERGAV